MKIIIELPEDRTKPGSLRLVDDNGLIVSGPFEAYGKADSGAATRHGNPTRIHIHPYGDTPLGVYQSVPVRTGHNTSLNFNSFGINGGLVLIPKSGDALFARNNGRTGLMIHGGVPGPNGKLRATNGCIRLSDADMKVLMQGVSNAAQKNMQCVVNPGMAVEVQLGLEDANYDEGDPVPEVERIVREQELLDEAAANEARRRAEEEERRAEEARRRAEEEQRRAEEARRRAEEERRNEEEARRRSEDARREAREAAREAREAAREAREAREHAERERNRARERHLEMERELRERQQRERERREREDDENNNGDLA